MLNHHTCRTSSKITNVNWIKSLYSWCFDNRHSTETFIAAITIQNTFCLLFLSVVTGRCRALCHSYLSTIKEELSTTSFTSRYACRGCIHSTDKWFVQCLCTFVNLFTEHIMAMSCVSVSYICMSGIFSKGITSTKVMQFNQCQGTSIFFHIGLSASRILMRI